MGILGPTVCPSWATREAWVTGCPQAGLLRRLKPDAIGYLNAPLKRCSTQLPRRQKALAFCDVGYGPSDALGKFVRRRDQTGNQIAIGWEVVKVSGLEQDSGVVQKGDRQVFVAAEKD